MNDQIERLPPHNREAERELLAAMLHNNAIVSEVVGLVDGKHFYVVGHQFTFQAIVDLSDRGEAVDVVTVAELLTARKQIDDAGGHAYLADLATNWPSAAVHREHARIIRGNATRRLLIQAGPELQTLGFDFSLTQDDMLAEAERLLLSITERQITGEPVHIGDTITETWGEFDERRNRNSRLKGIPSGLADLDSMTDGAHAGELIILAARPSIGKTAFAVNIARHAAVEERVPVLFVSLEQSRTKLTERFLCCQAQVDAHRMRTARLRTAETERVFRAGELLTRTRLFIDDTPDQNMMHIAASARRMKRLHGIGLVIVDYLQLITTDGKRDTRQEQVAGISRRCKLLARELEIPVMVCAQLNRQIEARQDQRPKLSDLRESGAIEQDADVVLMLHRQDDGLMDCVVAKQRDGPTGNVPMLFVKQHMRFEGYLATETAVH